MLQKLLAQKLRAPFCTAAIFSLVATKKARKTSSVIQWATASEGSPALWWWSWKLHHSAVWPIPPDNLWGTYRRMGQNPKKRVLNISVLREIYYCFHIFFMLQVSLALQGTPVRISRWNSQISFFHVSPRFPWVREGSPGMESAPSSPEVLYLN